MVVFFAIWLTAWVLIYIGKKQKLLHDQIRYLVTTYKIWYVQKMGKYKGLIKTAVDFLVFWVLFVWDDGIVAEHVKKLIVAFFTGVKDVLQSLWTFLESMWEIVVFLSPFGREMVGNPQFMYCVVIASIWVAVAFFIFACVLLDEYNWFASIFMTPVMCFAMWYLSYFACSFFKVYLIPFWFHVLAFVATSVISVISFVLILFVAIAFLETFD